MHETPARIKIISLFLILTLTVCPFVSYISAFADEVQNSISAIAEMATPAVTLPPENIVTPEPAATEDMATAVATPSTTDEQPQYTTPRMSLRSAVPLPFTYSGSYDVTEYAIGKFYARFLGSGTFKATRNLDFDAFLVGGGGNGAGSYYSTGSGGGGGYTFTALNQLMVKDESTNVTIGAAASPTYFKSLTAAGGQSAIPGSIGVWSRGGNGGSGGGLCGTGGIWTGVRSAAIWNGGDGGSNGSNGYAFGVPNNYTPIVGMGQGTNTYAFGGDRAPFNAMLFSGGGGAGGTNSDPEGKGGSGGGGNGGISKPTLAGDGQSGKPNTGGGGGGGGQGGRDYGISAGGNGGSGIVIIRWENHAPTISGTLSVPANVNRWEQSSYTITLPTVYDSDSDSLTKVIEYAVNGSGTFTQLTTTTSSSYIFTIPATNPASVKFRVKVVDPFGAESTYITSNWTTLVYNSPPTNPTGMGNPSAVNSWSSPTIVFNWNASTDLNGDTIKYVVEESINGGAWTSVQNSTSRSFSHAVSIPSHNYIQVRVRAFDNIEYSGYLTSGIVSITHDTTNPLIQVTAVPDATTSWAKDEIIITVTASDGLSGLKTLTVPSGVTPAGNIALSGASTTKTFKATANGTYSFTVTDNAGKSASASVAPSKIDGDFPTITYTTNPPAGEYTNGNVDIDLIFADASAGLASFSGLNGSETLTGYTATKTFTATANGVYPFSVTDAVNHITAINALVNMIDRIKPVATIVPRVNQWTNAAFVISDITGKDDYSGVNSLMLPDGSSFAGAATTYEITSNGEYTASATDRATNVSDTAALNYAWFDRTKPTIQFVRFEQVASSFTKFVTGLFGTVSNKHLRMIVEASDTPDAGEGESGVTTLFYRIFKADNTLVQDWHSTPISTPPTIDFEVNGYVEVYVKDAAGTPSETETHDILIDTTPSTYEVIYSTTDITDQPVTVTLILHDEPNGSGEKGWILPEGSVLFPQAEITYTFSENSVKTYIGYDKAGNLVEAEIRVSNIQSPLVPVEAWENNKVVMEAVQQTISKAYIEDVTETDLRKIKYLDLSSNGLTSLPAIFAKIENLEYLDLRGNEFVIVPDCVYELGHLKRLYLSNNDLTTLDNKIRSLTRLNTLDISLNYFVDYELPMIVPNYLHSGNFTNNNQPNQYSFKMMPPETSKEYIGNTAQLLTEWIYNGEVISGSLESHRKMLFNAMYPAYRTYRPMLYRYHVQNGQIEAHSADYVQVHLLDSGVMSATLELGAESE